MFRDRGTRNRCNYIVDLQSPLNSYAIACMPSGYPPIAIVFPCECLFPAISKSHRTFLSSSLRRRSSSTSRRILHGTRRFVPIRINGYRGFHQWENKYCAMWTFCSHVNVDPYGISQLIVDTSLLFNNYLHSRTQFLARGMIASSPEDLTSKWETWDAEPSAPHFKSIIWMFWLRWDNPIKCIHYISTIATSLHMYTDIYHSGPQWMFPYTFQTVCIYRALIEKYDTF